MGRSRPEGGCEHETKAVTPEADPRQGAWHGPELSAALQGKYLKRYTFHLIGAAPAAALFIISPTFIFLKVDSG